jgi:hypothetical protein
MGASALTGVCLIPPFNIPKAIKMSVSKPVDSMPSVGMRVAQQTVVFSLTAAGRSEVNLRCAFPVRRIRVKYLLPNFDTGNNLYMLDCDSISDDTWASFSTHERGLYTASIAQDIYLGVPRSFSNTVHTFTFYTTAGAVASLTGTAILQLEYHEA